MAQVALKSDLQLRKPKNADRREREHLTPHEVERLMKAAKASGRHGHRNSTLILLAYRHGLRVSELVRLEWLQVDLFGQINFRMSRLNLALL